jgi:hypothetical protein
LAESRTGLFWWSLVVIAIGLVRTGSG